MVLAATFFCQMKPNEMWIAFSTGKNCCFISINEIVSLLTPKTCSSLQHSMLSQAATLCLPLEEKEKNNLGNMESIS